MSERARGFLVVANICSLVNKVKSEAIVWSTQVNCIARQMESTIEMSYCRSINLECSVDVKDVRLKSNGSIPGPKGYEMQQPLLARHLPPS